MKRQVVVSAPGSTMLFGEHSVLHGGSAVVCAVASRLRVAASLRDDGRVVIRSALGNLNTSLSGRLSDATHRFTLALVERWKSRFAGGIELDIVSDFSHTLGLGSSAALVVAVAGALRCISGLPLVPQKMRDECLAVVRDIQGSGSGADLIASLYGGVVHYRPATCNVTQLAEDIPICLYYSGYKTATPEVIAKVAAESGRAVSLYDHLYRLMGECTLGAAFAIRDNNLSKLACCMNIYHGLLESLGVCDRTLADMVHSLRESGCHGAKISGSGLGDCVVALCSHNGGPVLPGHKMIPITIAKQGVHLDYFPE